MTQKLNAEKQEMRRQKKEAMEKRSLTNKMREDESSRVSED
jgi:hypothetical protein